jgi:hypothetical protein
LSALFRDFARRTGISDSGDAISPADADNADSLQGEAIIDSDIIDIDDGQS